MKLFNRKPKKPARAGVDASQPTGKSLPGGTQSNGKTKATPTSHRLTMDLARAESLARMLAASRASNAVEVADLLAGMYIYEWERLSKYWDDQDAVEEFLQQICQMSPQRWNSWLQLYDKKQRGDEKPSKWSALRKRAQEKPEERLLPRSIEVESLLRNAEMITPFRDKVDGQSLPILTSESVLLCIALNHESEISRKLSETGLDVAGLERAARDRRRAPLAWRDDA
jgi:hypothetical protein